MNATPLNRANLSNLAASVRKPAYDPASVTPGIVHLGLGGFHRAHMARYTHELMEKRPDMRDWGIVGAGILPNDEKMRDALVPQNGLYTLVERSMSEERVSIIGSVVRVIYAGQSSAELLDAIDDPRIRIVSLTVTENGYCLNRATKQLDFEHVLIKGDLATPELPKSAIGIIVEAYRRRRDKGGVAFTAMTCDNIQHNGNVLKAAVMALASKRDPALAQWIEQNASFPNTMVDRITPVTSAAEVADLAARHGVADAWPVFSEIFTQWVIEDQFVRGRPAWEDVGAQFVEDVTPYEFMKLRLLNGSHLAVSGLGRLSGYVYIDESMADPLIARHMTALMDRETGPTLMPVPGIDIPRYKRTLVERFTNDKIKDTNERVNTDAPLNVLVDPIRDCLKMGISVELLSLALAAWMRRVRGVDEEGQPIEVKHPLAGLLAEKAIEGNGDPRPLLSIEQLFGSIGSDPRLIDAVGKWLSSLYAVGAKATLKRASEELGF